MSATYYDESEFNGDVTFHRGVRFYGKVSGLETVTSVSYARHLQSKDISGINIGAIPYQSTLGDEPITSFINSGANGYFLKSNGPGTAPSWAEVAAPVEAIPSGSVMIFYQASAPTGWTKQTTHNDKSLRVVSGTGGGSGGSTAFTSVFTSRTPSGSVSSSFSGGTNGASANISVQSTTLSTGQLANHGHSFENGFFAENNGNYGNFGNNTVGSNNGGDSDNRPFTQGDTTGGAGSGNSHSHSISQSDHSHGLSGSVSSSFSGSSMDFAVQYIDVIICTRN